MAGETTQNIFTSCYDRECEGQLEIEKKQTEIIESDIKLYYKTICSRLNIPVISRFARQIQTDRVNLKHYGINYKDIHAILATLKKCPSVVTLNLPGNTITGKGATCVANMLKTNRFITHLDLSENRIGRAGVNTIGEMMFRNSSLMKMNLSKNFLHDEDILKLVDSLKANLHLKWLSLSYNKLGQQAGIRIGSMLTINSTLEHLDVCWNEIPPKGTTSIALGLTANKSLKVLNLSWNRFADGGANAVKQLLLKNKSLTVLNITNTSVGLYGAKSIAKGIERNTTLRTLKAGRNPFLSPGVVSLLKSILVNEKSAVFELYLGGVSLDHECKKLLEDLLERRPGFICYSDVPIHYGRVVGEVATSVAPLDIFVAVIKKRQLRTLDLWKSFRMIDGKITKNVFVKGIQSLETGMSKTMIKSLFDFMDESGDGILEFGELRKLIIKRKTAAMYSS